MNNNTILLIGRVATDPEIRTSQAGKAYGNVIIKWESRNKRDGGYAKGKITCFGGASNVLRELRVGDEVLAVCRLEPNTFEFEGKEKISWQVVAEKIVKTTGDVGSSAHRQDDDNPFA